MGNKGEAKDTNPPLMNESKGLSSSILRLILLIHTNLIKIQNDPLFIRGTPENNRRNIADRDDNEITIQLFQAVCYGMQCWFALSEHEATCTNDTTKKLISKLLAPILESIFVQRTNIFLTEETKEILNETAISI